MLLERKLPNVETVVSRLISSLKLKITKTTIFAELERHPEYPSMLSVSDVLNQFKIRNGAFNITSEKLRDIPLPFIAHLREQGGLFVLVERIVEDKIYCNNKGYNYLEFAKSFDGNVLVIDSADYVGETEYKSLRRLEVLNEVRPAIAIIGSLILVAIGLLSISGYFAALKWYTVLAMLSKTIGLITSTLLLVQSIDKNNPLIQRLCQSANNKDCTAILTSKAAKVFDGLSWSEVGFFYFSGTWLCLLFDNTSIPVLQFLTIINILALPYTFYSIYYQAFIARQWCLFCCIIQGVLWLEFIPLFLSFNNSYVRPQTKDFEIILICFLAPTLLWIFTKPYFLASQQIKPLKDQLQKFKYNSDIFSRLLHDNPKYETPGKEWSVVLGNPNAQNIITMVSNPYCNPCSKAHQLLSAWLGSSDNIQVRLIFAATRDRQEKRRKLAEHLMSLDALGDHQRTEEAIADWYRKKNYDDFIKKYPVEYHQPVSEKLDRQFDWLLMTGISATPTILVNGRELPHIYQIDDLKYMLEI